MERNTSCCIVIEIIATINSMTAQFSASSPSYMMGDVIFKEHVDDGTGGQANNHSRR